MARLIGEAEPDVVVIACSTASGGIVFPTSTLTRFWPRTPLA
jgi:hypothetical protein